MPEADSTNRKDESADGHACLHRGPDDDFFCLRYRVWYPSIDCAARTRFESCGGCLNCDQGRFNLKRHQSSLDDPALARRSRRVMAALANPAP